MKLISLLLTLIILLLSSTTALALEPPNDPRMIGSDPNNWQQWGLEKIDAKGGWDTTYGSPDIKIAIIDSGINENHEDLQGKVVDRVNFSCDPDTSDYGGQLGFGHGTIVAGIAAAATDNNIGIAGMGFNSSILNVKVTGANCITVDPGTLIQAIEWSVQNGAKVINISLSDAFLYNSAVDAAIQNAWNSGVVVVAAAGNDNSSNFRYPAAYNNVISVAATNKNDAKVPESNYGSWVSVAAPGIDIEGPCSNVNDGYCQLDNTSAAAPLVSGLAALIWARHAGEPGFDQSDVKSLIESTADEISQTGNFWIHGRINACRALGGGSSCVLLNYVDPNLIAHWRMDESSWVNDCNTLTVLDSTISSYHGKNCPPTIKRSPLNVAGKYGNGGLFDGVDDNIQIPDKDYFSPSQNDLTIAFWAKIPTSATASGNGYCGSTGRYFIAKGTSNNWEWGVENDNNNRLCALIWNSAGTAHNIVELTGQTLNDNQWHFYSMVIDYPGTMYFYRDGALVGNSALTLTNINGTQPVQIAGRGDGNYFSGVMDDILHYSRALSSSEVSNIYSNTAPSDYSGYWKLDENSWIGDCTSLTVVDSSSNNNAGKACPADNTGTLLVPGKFNSGGSFDGVDDYVEILDKDYFSPSTNDMTVSFWAKIPTSATAYGNGACGSAGRFFMAKGNSGNWEWGVENDSNNRLCAVIWNAGGSAGNYVDISGQTLNDNQWHFYSMVIDYQSTISLYRDGSLLGSSPITLTMSNAAHPVQIGRSGVGNYFSGIIDDVRIFNQTLSGAVISQLYNTNP